MKKQPYGTTSGGSAVTEYTLTNANGVEVKIITYGGTITSIRLPDRSHQGANVVLGFGSLQEYETKSPYFGCITGRYANRIAGGKFTLDGTQHQLDLNNGPATLHGGLRGFDKVIWAVTKEITGEEAGGEGIELHYLSPDGDQHFPGALDTFVTYVLNDRNELLIHYRATTDKPTIVNLTNHTLWNLGGEGSGAIDDHVLKLNAPQYTPVDAAAIPTGELADVAGTPFDFRTPKQIGEGSAPTTRRSRSARGLTTTGCWRAAGPPPLTWCRRRWCAISPAAACSRYGPPSRASSSTRATSWTGRSLAPAGVRTGRVTAWRWRRSIIPTRPTSRTSPRPCCAQGRPTLPPPSSSSTCSRGFLEDTLPRGIRPPVGSL